MADEADLAFAVEQQSLEAAIAAQRRSRPALQATGECHYCGEHLKQEGQLFCDIDCANDWEQEQALRKRLGLPRS